MKYLFTISVVCVLAINLFGQKFGTLSDARDGQVYKTVEIGNKLWMAQNLNFYCRNSWCYDNEDDNCKNYGRIYTWNAAMNGQSSEKSRGICPEGWHIPTDSEWLLLVKEYGQSKDLFKEGTSGFEMPLGGCRFPDGKFDFAQKVATYWTSTADTTYSNFVFTRYAYADNKTSPLTSYSTNKTYGQYLRCVKD